MRSTWELNRPLWPFSNMQYVRILLRLTMGLPQLLASGIITIYLIPYFTDKKVDPTDIITFR